MRLRRLAVPDIVRAAGCGGTEVVRPAVNVSVGQQLIDLKKARDSGALSQREYDSLRARILRRPS